MTTEVTPDRIRDALAALGVDQPEEVSRSDWPELVGRLLGAAYAQLRREDMSDGLDVATENARVAAAYQEVMAPLGDPRTVTFEAAFAAVRHFRLLAGALEAEEPLLRAATQLLQVTAMACGMAFLSPNQVLLSAEERTATGEALQEEVDETFGSLRVLERAARRMVREAR
jgi:hypothetical protein